MVAFIHVVAGFVNGSAVHGGDSRCRVHCAGCRSVPKWLTAIPLAYGIRLAFIIIWRKSEASSRVTPSYRPHGTPAVSLGAVTLSALPLPGSDFGVYLTLATMRGMVYREFMNPLVRLTAADIVAGLNGQDGAEQARAIRDYLEIHTEFLRDPDGVEMLHGPVWQVQQIRARGVEQVDCDDVAMLGAALGKAVGLRARFVVVGFDRRDAPYRHVWVELSPRARPQWIDMDVTRPAQGLAFNRIARVLTKEV